MAIQTVVRPHSSALVPGVTLFREVGTDGYPRRRIRASAMIKGKQRLRSWSPIRYGLDGALWQACAWRLKHAPGAAETVEHLVRQARETLEQRWDGSAKR